jgi:hypothetical protein
MSSSRRHIPYLSFHKTIIREICRPQKDDLLILAKGLGMRRVGRHSIIPLASPTMLLTCWSQNGWGVKQELMVDHLCAIEDVR